MIYGTVNTAGQVLRFNTGRGHRAGACCRSSSGMVVVGGSRVLLVFEGILLNHQDDKLRSGRIFFSIRPLCAEKVGCCLNHGFHGQETHLPVESP